ncbi:TIGR02206 family membrane protein [Paenibacillus lautus]|uniref:YwaF family protein n=1 Tax=Paenibacillus lautus TaxID=1401 RepID=UPI00204038C4|nr:TIGR02206 family membrane protein [Paenibacillus lautus]MCM3258985.1 TIGR02206 family membrane protein [Paenibacillus lautus]
MVISNKILCTFKKEWSCIESYFDPQYPEAFAAFSVEHWIAIGICIILGLLLYLFRTAIASKPSLQKTVRWGLLAALALPEASLHVWYVSTGIWDPATSLPLELCSLTLFLSIAILLTDKRRLYPLVYFAGIGGALQAVLTPNLGYPFPHFRFFHFFVVHIAIIMTALYMTWVRGYRPTWKSIAWTMVFLNVSALLVGLVNLVVGSNYMFLMRKPDTASLLDLLGPHPVYIVVEELIALSLFILMHVAFFVIPDRMRRSRRRKHEPASLSSTGG